MLGARRVPKSLPDLLSDRVHLPFVLHDKLFSTLPNDGLLYTESIDFGAHNGLPPERLAVVLPGLLGQGKNLRSFVASCLGQVAQQSGASWRALLVDLRNHGKSGAGFPGPHSLDAAAGDVVRTVQAAGRSTIDVLLGHSLGGKVALAAARQLGSPDAPLPPPSQVWVLDSRPGRVESSRGGGTDDVLAVLNAIAQVPLPVASREELYWYLQQRGFSRGLQAWLGSNLVLQRDSGKYAWNFSLEGARAMYDSYRTTDYWDVVGCPPAKTELHLVMAALSDRWDAAAAAELQAAVQAAGKAAQSCGMTSLHTVPGGHWLHVDNPAALTSVMLPHLFKASVMGLGWSLQGKLGPSIISRGCWCQVSWRW